MVPIPLQGGSHLDSHHKQPPGLESILGHSWWSWTWNHNPMAYRQGPCPQGLKTFILRHPSYRRWWWCGWLAYRFKSQASSCIPACCRPFYRKEGLSLGLLSRHSSRFLHAVGHSVPSTFRHFTPPLGWDSFCLEDLRSYSIVRHQVAGQGIPVPSSSYSIVRHPDASQCPSIVGKVLAYRCCVLLYYSIV